MSGLLPKKLLAFVGAIILIIGFYLFIGRPGIDSPDPLDNSPVEIGLRFAVMADIHADWENWQRALAKASTDNVEFAIIAGDVTTVGNKSELTKAKQVLNQSGIKYYVVPGNHDLWLGRKTNQDLFSEVFGADYQSFYDHEVKFILINNGDWQGIASAQWEWIEKQLVDCSRIACLVFMHMPLNHPQSAHVMGEDGPATASQAAELARLLVANQVKEVFAGHLHYSSEYEIAGLKTTIVGAITAERNWQEPRYIEVEVKGDKIDSKEVVIGDKNQKN